MDLSSIELDITSLLSNSHHGILSSLELDHLAFLRSERQKILDHTLLTWQLKSRAKWNLKGDFNTKYFHMLASGRRNQNSIWSLSDDSGSFYEDEDALKSLGMKHFANIFKDDGGTSIFQQLKVIQLFPRMVPKKNASNLSCPVSIGEIEHALKSFKKDRSPGSDG